MDYRCWSTRGSSLCRDVRRDRSRKTCEGIRRVRRELLPDVPVLRVLHDWRPRGNFQRAPFATSLRFLWLERAFPPNREQKESRDEFLEL